MQCSPRLFNPFLHVILFVGLLSVTSTVGAQTPTVLDDAITIRPVVQVPSNTIRVVGDPLSGDVFVLRGNGTIYRVNVATQTITPVYTSDDHGLGDKDSNSNENVMGIAVADDGTLFVLASVRTATTSHFEIMRGVPGASDNLRAWTMLAMSDEYPSATNQFDHFTNGLVVSPDGQHLFMNSGSRSDHGEIQNQNGALVDDPREYPLTSAIFRIPLGEPETVVLQNNEDSLRAKDYFYADGVRNSFDLAFDPHGNLLATENSGDRDDSDELNWIQEGHHYGFPWRMGTNDNQMRVQGYDAASDLLLNPNSYAANENLYYHDENFPAPPQDVVFTDPLANLGQDANFYRDSTNGNIIDADNSSEKVYSFTAHRSPLGLTFDTELVLAAPYLGSGFALSWTGLNSQLLGPFGDPSEDLLHLAFVVPLGGGTEPTEFLATRLVTGFSNPIDAELIDEKMYVLDLAFGGTATMWELTFPRVSGSGTTAEPSANPDVAIVSTYPNPAHDLVSIAYTVAHSMARNETVTVSIVDLTGRTMYSQIQSNTVAGRRQAEIDVSSLASGIYFAKVETERSVAFNSFAVVR